MLKELHDGLIGGHYVADTITEKIMRVGFYWPTLFKDAHTYVQKCLIYQKFVERESRFAAPLQPIAVEGPFQ